MLACYTNTLFVIISDCQKVNQCVCESYFFTTWKWSTSTVKIHSGLLTNVQGQCLPIET